MSTPFGFPFGMDPESLRDAPLFRELQRVIASGGSGSVNWELARQVGVATAVEAGPDPETTDEDLRGLEDAVRIAELQVAGLTGLDNPAHIARVRAIRRAEWVARETEGLHPLIEPAAARMTEALDRAVREQMPPEAAQMAGMFAQLGPLLQGTQVGQVLGTAATTALSGSEIAVPRGDTVDISFVPTNLAAVERDWSLDRPEFRTWIALHEVAHRATLTRPWTAAHLTSLVDDFLSTLTIDVGAITERLQAIEPGDPESLERALGGGDAMFGAVLDEEQRIKLARVHAFLAAAEGWADHVTTVIGHGLLGTHERIEEALRRRQEGREQEPIFTRLLGIPVDLDVFDLGRRFCDTVVQRTDEATLAKMWASADAAPSLPELHEPTLWLSRTV